jgi:hypothetical protein
LQIRRASGVSPISSAQAATYQALRMNMAVSSCRGFSRERRPPRRFSQVRKEARVHTELHGEPRSFTEKNAE